MAPRASVERIRGRRLPNPRLTNEELRIIVAEYIPETARRLRLPGIGPIRFHPHRKRGTGGIALLPGGGLWIKGGHHNAGAPTVPCFWVDDEFYPALEWAAHHIARRIRFGRRSGRRHDDLARRFGMTLDRVYEAVHRPAEAVPKIVSELRGWDVSARALAKFRASWRRTLPRRMSRREEHEVLERFARDFLADRPSRRPAK